MLKRKIKYTDYDGNEREEVFCFNLSKAEVAEMELSVEGGLMKKIQGIVDAQSTPQVIALFKDILLKSYGEKSNDGKRFIKSEELSLAFSQTEAYSNLFVELMTDAEAAAAFMNAIIPSA